MTARSALSLGLAVGGPALSNICIDLEQAFGSLRRGGTVVFVALPADNRVQLSIWDIVTNHIRILGSTLGNRVDLAETFELQAAGRTRVITEVRKLEQVNEAFAEVESGKAKARLVFDLR